MKTTFISKKETTKEIVYGNIGRTDSIFVFVWFIINYILLILSLYLQICIIIYRYTMYYYIYYVGINKYLLQNKYSFLSK